MEMRIVKFLSDDAIKLYFCDIHTHTHTPHTRTPHTHTTHAHAHAHAHAHTTFRCDLDYLSNRSNSNYLLQT